MIVPDANLLVCAYDKSSIFHDRACAWWDGCLSGREVVGLTHPSVFAFVRITTNPRAFASPMSLDEAAEHVLSWLERRVSQVLQPPSDHVTDVLALLKGAGGAGGNLVSDAQIAALAQAHRAVVHTADRDFLRFAGIRCHFPLDDA
jgi:toxin-antitoxin system PIN domain toxin